MGSALPGEPPAAGLPRTVHDPGFEPGYAVDLLRCRDMPFDWDAGSRTLVLEPEYGGRWGVSNGCLTRTLPIAINDPKGSWQVSVNEWLTKHRSTVTFEVR